MQANKLLSPDELGGLAKDLGIITPELSEGTRSLTRLFTQLGLTSRCVSNVLVPTGNIVINDQFATGQENFKEFFYGAVAQAGEGANFDGNGQFLRIQPGGGPVEVATPVPGGSSITRDDVLYGNTIMAPDRHPASEAGQGAGGAAGHPLLHATTSPTSKGPQAAIGPPNPDATP